MPSEELTAEIEAGIDEVIAEREAADNETVADKVVGDGVVEGPGSSDAEVVAEVDANDQAAADLAAANEAAASELAGQGEAVATEAGADAVKEAGESHIKPPEAPPAPGQYAVSDSTLARAVNVGIPVEDAIRLTPGSLEMIISLREEEAADDRVKGDSGLQERLEKAVDPFADFPKLDPEVHDPSVIAMFDKLTGIAKGQYETIQKFQADQAIASTATEAREAAELDAAAQEVEQFFDRQVEGLGDNFSEALGTGGYSSLDRGSSQFASREAIAGQMSVLISGYHAQGLTPPSREEVFDMAARTVLRDTFQGLREKELAGSLANQSGQHIQRAGSTQAKMTKTPEEDAAAAVDEFLSSK